MRTKAEKTKSLQKKKEEEEKLKKKAEEEEEESAPVVKAIKLETSTESGSSSSNSNNKMCLMCGKIHNDEEILKYVSVLPEDGQYRCHHCSESFSYSCLFAAHIRTCSNAYPGTKSKSSINTVSAVPKDAVSTSAAISKTSGSTDNGFKCVICSRIFTSQVVLTNHVERMHGAKGPTECEFCRKKYSSLVDLIVHKKTHVGATPYQCQYCDQKFMTRSMVNEHERIHTGDTPYRCEFCNRGFSYRSNLIVHKRIHDSKRNHFECDQCGQTFQHGAQLTRHKLMHTTDKPLDCRHCGKRFEIYNKLIEHIKEEHPNKSCN